MPTSIWRPETVELPRRRSSGGAHLVRLRLLDRPGSLATVTAALAQHGVDVLRLEVLGREGGFAIDDLLVEGGHLDAALAALGTDVSLLAMRAGVDLHDPGLAMAEACCALTRAANDREAYRQLLVAALGLVFAEAGFVCVARGDGLLRPVAATDGDLPALDEREPSLLASALWSGECLTADGRAPWVPTSYRARLPEGTVAVVPGGEEPFLALALVREDGAPFVPTELQRLAALVRVAVGTLLLHGVEEARRPQRLTAWGAHS